MKICTRCGIEKPFKEFAKNKDRPNGVGSWCKLCKNQDRQRHRTENPGKTKASHQDWYYNKGGRQTSLIRKRQYRFGVTEEKFLELSKNGCAVCGTFENFMC